MSAPVRIRRRRTRGWKMPPNTVYVGRPTKWGNPFDFRRAEHCWNALAFGCRGDAAGRREASVVAFRQWLCDPRGRIKELDFCVVLDAGEKTVEIGPRVRIGAAPSIAEIRSALRGKNLACWCPLDRPCHADVLLELANR